MHTSTTVHKSTFSGLREENRTLLDFDVMKKAFFTLRSVSHPLRKKILHLLEKNGPLTVTEIYIKLRLEQSVASHHLSVLRTAGAVKTERDGKFVHYSLNKERISAIANHIKGLTHFDRCY